MESRRSRFAVRFTSLCATLALIAPPSAALERLVAVEGPGPGEHASGAASTCTVSYYANCTFLYYLWTLNRAGETLGVVFDACTPSARLNGVWTWEFETVPAGWGYTGIISVHAVDDHDAPTGPALAASPFIATGGWSYYPLSTAVPSRFVVTSRYDGVLPGGIGARPTLDNPICFLRTEPHSYFFGTPDAPLSPGSPFDVDPGGYAELFYCAEMSSPTGLDPGTWAGVKNLYR